MIHPWFNNPLLKKIDKEQREEKNERENAKQINKENFKKLVHSLKNEYLQKT